MAPPNATTTSPLRAYLGKWAPFRTRSPACQGCDLPGLACSRSCDRLVSLHLPKGRQLMRSVLDIILLILQIYIWLLIAAAVLSWLVAFNVVNTHNQVVAMIGDFLFRITEPLL